MNKEILIAETKKYLARSYSPYSNFKVAACVVTKDNAYFGVNIENASYGLSMCAERNAIFQAYIAGIRKEDIQQLILVCDHPELAYPCGACRQVMVEMLPLDTPVTMANDSKELIMSVEELLPCAFMPDNLD